MTRISILGSGVVGTCMGRGLLRLGHQVTFYDINGERVNELRREGLDATDEVMNAIADSALSFICVPTPTIGGRISLNSIQSIVKDLGECLGTREDYHVVVVKSTVTPGTTQRIIVPEIERYSDKKVGEGIGVCSNPEFLTEIHGSWTRDHSYERGFFDEPVIVIGEWDKRSGDCLADLYKPLNRPIVRTNLLTSETIKYAFNCALATRISYWNEVFCICRLLGVDSRLVAQTAAMDDRIGQYGTVHGKAFGGKCLPKDLRAFIEFASNLGYEPKLLKAVEEINLRIKEDEGVRE